MRICRDHLSQDRVVDTKILVADSIAYRPDLSPWLSRVFREPLIRNPPDGLGDGLDSVWGSPPRYRVCLEAIRCRPSRHGIQDRDLRQAVPDGNQWVLGHHRTRTASRSMVSRIAGWSALRVVIVT